MPLAILMLQDSEGQTNHISWKRNENWENSSSKQILYLPNKRCLSNLNIIQKEIDISTTS